MRHVALLLALFGLAAFGPARPKLRAVAGTFWVAPDSTVTVRLATSLMSGTLQPGDSIRYKVYKDGVAVFNRQSVDTTMLASGLPAPAYGATSSYKPCVVPTRSGVNMGGETCGTVWTYTRPGGPPVLRPPTITPASATVRPGQTLTVTVTL